MADHLGLEPGMLWVRVPPELLKRSNERPRGAAWSARDPVTVEIAGSNPAGDAFKQMARYASRKSGQAQTLVNCLRVRLPPAPLNKTFPHGLHGQVVQLDDTRRSERRPLVGRGSSNLPLATFDDLTQVSQCSAEPHKLSEPGATPGPAICGRVRKPWQSGERPPLRGGARSLVILWVRRPPRLLTTRSRGPTATTPG